MYLMMSKLYFILLNTFFVNLTFKIDHFIRLYIIINK